MSEVEKRRIVPGDLMNFKWVSDPQLSPCGTRIAYVLTHIEDKKYRQAIWMVPVAGGEPIRFTSGPKVDKSPRWSPDGKKLAFLSDRDGSTQIWVMDVLGGEALQVTRQKGGAADLAWSPDSQKLLFTSKWSPDDDKPSDDKEKSDVKVITRLHYKTDGKGFWDGKYTHVYTISACGGEATHLTHGEYDYQNPTWSPDGKYIAFVANLTEDVDYTSVKDVYVVPALGGEFRKVTPGLGPCANPSFSPDGNWIAYFGHDQAFRGATLNTMWLVPFEGGMPRNLTPGMTSGSAAGSDSRYGDNPMKPMWSNCCCNISFVASKGGTSDIYRVFIADGNVEQLSEGNHSVFGASMNGVPARFATAVGSFLNPGDIYVYSVPEKKWTRLTTVNKALLDSLHLSKPETIRYKSFDGWEVEGWVMKPIGFKEGTKYPTILEIHGGPHSAYGNAFFMEMQLHAADGFGVILTNPRGSEAYGQEFVAATKHDWGVGDYKDIIAGVDYAIGQGWIDEHRLGLTGGSYGGYMTNWIIGQTNRFIAGVACRSTSNRYSQFGISDAAYNNGDYEFPGTPWENPLYYLERSPITYVKNITTPLLLISNESDLRCPVPQAEEMFTALKLLKKTVEMVRIPNESHELSRAGQPVHRVERYERMNGWFKKYIERYPADYSV